MDLKGIRRERADWFQLAQDRDEWRVLVTNAMNFLVP
jgi:hypothetical protein